MARWVMLTQADNRTELVWLNIDEASYMQRAADSGPEYTLVYFPAHTVKVVETPAAIGRLMLTQKETR